MVKVKFLFESVDTVATPGALEFLAEQKVKPGIYLARHFSGDWGDLGDFDKKMNDEALKSGEDRIFSMYKVGDGKIYIITEWDRSVTTLLLSEEY